MSIFSRAIDFASSFKKSEKAHETPDGYQPFLNVDQVNRTNLLSNNKNWVFVAVDKIATATSSVRFKVMRASKGKKGKEGTEVFTGPLYEFINKPHPRLTWRDFVYLNAAFKEITGNAFWKVNERIKDGIIPLNPLKVTPLIKDGVMIGYKYQNGMKIEALTLEEVLHDRFPSITNPFWGSGPLEKIAQWVDIDSYAAEFNRIFFVNGAAFGGFLETDEESKERIELIRIGLKNNHVGIKNAHKLGVLPKNTKFKESTQTMSDMQFTEQDDHNRDKILSAFGVPKTLTGLTTEVNRASAEASEYIFAKYTIEPKVLRFVDFLNNFVVPLFDKTGTHYIWYDEFIPENNELKIRETEVALNKQPYMTVNEVRLGKGLPKVPGGDVVYGNPNATPLGEVVEPEEVKEEKDALSVLIEKAADMAVRTFDQGIDKDQEAHKAFVSRADGYQKQVQDKVVDFNSRQKNRVIQRLNSIAKAVRKSDVFDMDEEVSIMVDAVSPILRGLLTEQAIEEYIAQGFEGEMNMEDVNVSTIIERAATRMAKSYNKTTATLLKQALNEGIAAGEGLRELTERVSQVYEFSDSYRAGMVAHTEAFYVANEANKEAYRQSGVVKSIKWYTADSDACQFCSPLNGKEVGISEVFFKKGDVYEGRDGGKLNLDYRTIDVPPIHPNCRCFIRPEQIGVSDKSQEEFEAKLSEVELINELEAIFHE